MDKIMPYETYKLLHIAFIFLGLITLGLALLADSKKKWVKIVNGISFLMILVSGMGLMARIGISHGEPFPFWIKGKFAFWGILAIGGPISVKRFESKKPLIFFIFFAVAVMAVHFAINKF
ncbi:MAG: hypothetical protein E2O68_04030 [Deltaproteobacteria bacterium]|nr:MAG: hypothetical protein E2O68_04030 [Deltaproteobacteria bacterium]